MNFAVALVALAVEWLVGYPGILQRYAGHPVQWMGKLIDWSDTSVNSPEESPSTRKAAGILTLVLLIGGTFLITSTLSIILRTIPFGWIVEGILVSSLLAGKQLRTAVYDVASGLGDSLGAGRAAVAHIVGRDTTRLDDTGVAGAAVETLAENTSDGLVAPLFYLLIFGLPGIAVYKAINTADSMIGHRNVRYADFGWAAARLDDVANWIPARLTALLFVAASYVTPGAQPGRAWQAARADAPKHRSLNAGWPEAAMAGALGISLGGPREYNGQLVDLPAMGNGRSDLDALDILSALKLYERAMIICAAVTGVGLVIAAPMI